MASSLLITKEAPLVIPAVVKIQVANAGILVAVARAVATPAEATKKIRAHYIYMLD